ncbi:hypothetical protein PR202_gb11306 [Eleusine coracana subsp. coracana]|uniref:Adenylosuccinate synthetase n=1 Tax=Eleusine coracana subsp. coracana TaxID=191504 RepID=A0AAV5EN48_ELECO|nr:hypothetical protein PR202_gb11306 [Eleusine coracana subsp. coracana]
MITKILKEEVEKYERFAERLEPFIADTVHFMNESILQKKKILVEGGQATMLDIDFGSTYPFVYLLKSLRWWNLYWARYCSKKPWRSHWSVESFPADLDLLEQIKVLVLILNSDFIVKYEVLPGWENDISSVRDYNDLPETARLYIQRIEELVGIPVHYIGVGPGRDALIYK